MSDKILDADGNELLYWPVGAIQAGHDSETIDIQVLCSPGQVLVCEDDPNGVIYGSPNPIGPFLNLATTPIDLTPFGAGYHTFTIYFHASEDAADPVRVPLTLGVAGHSPAGWGL